MTASIRVVFDCNIYFQALISPSGPSGLCLSHALAGRVRLFCSEFVINEIQSTTRHPKLREKFATLTDAAIKALINDIERVGTFIDVFPEPFQYTRDPDDAHYVNLALAAQAKYVVSRDNDLLDLMNMARAEAREFRSRFPSLEIIEPPHLLRELDALNQST